MSVGHINFHELMSSNNLLLLLGTTSLMGFCLEKRYIDLHSLQTDPKYKRRGAGTMLIQVVIEEAQKRGMIAYLESTEAGHSLYKGQGFEDVEMHEIDMSKWGAAETHKTWAMKWEPTKNS